MFVTLRQDGTSTRPLCFQSDHSPLAEKRWPKKCRGSIFRPGLQSRSRLSRRSRRQSFQQGPGPATLQPGAPPLVDSCRSLQKGSGPSSAVLFRRFSAGLPRDRKRHAKSGLKTMQRRQSWFYPLVANNGKMRGGYRKHTFLLGNPLPLAQVDSYSGGTVPILSSFRKLKTQKETLGF